MDRTGLKILRLNLDAFIRADPVMITLSRPNKVATDNGSWTYGTPTPVDPQQMRLVPFKRRVSDDVKDTDDGQNKLANYILTCHYNVDAQPGDEFSHNNVNYRVRDIEPKTNDRTSTDRVTLILEVRDPNG